MAAGKNGGARVGGRKLTPEVSKRITDALAAGAYFAVAVQSAGVSSSASYDWMQRGRDCIAWQAEHGVRIEDIEDRQYIDFVEAVEESNAVAEMHALATLRRGDNGWQAQAWFLERRFPERWRRRDHVTIDDKTDSPQVESVKDIRTELENAEVAQMESELVAVLKAHGTVGG